MVSSFSVIGVILFWGPKNNQKSQVILNGVRTTCSHTTGAVILMIPENGAADCFYMKAWEVTDVWTARELQAVSSYYRRKCLLWGCLSHSYSVFSSDRIGVLQRRAAVSTWYRRWKVPFDAYQILPVCFLCEVFKTNSQHHAISLLHIYFVSFKSILFQGNPKAGICLYKQLFIFISKLLP